MNEISSNKEISLKGTAGTPVVMVEKITTVESVTEAQNNLRNAWMKK